LILNTPGHFLPQRIPQTFPQMPAEHQLTFGGGGNGCLFIIVHSSSSINIIIIIIGISRSSIICNIINRLINRYKSLTINSHTGVTMYLHGNVSAFVDQLINCSSWVYLCIVNKSVVCINCTVKSWTACKQFDHTTETMWPYIVIFFTCNISNANYVTLNCIMCFNHIVL